MKKKIVKFAVGDDPQEYLLSYDFNELADAEAVCGQNLLSPIFFGTMTAGQLRGTLYAYLRGQHTKVTLAEAGALLTKDRNTAMRAVAFVMNGGEGPLPPQKKDVASALADILKTTTEPPSPEDASGMPPE